MRISSAESLVMDVLWRDGPRTADQVCAAVAAEQNWTAATVKTLLSRLLTKGALTAERDGRRYLYRPALSRDDYVHGESRGVIERLFGGQVAPLVAHFSARERLTPEDIAALKRLIEEMDDGR
ncbi:BlaI/MecI/CopY family transcriptional regulator [Brevundimonas sp. 2R-24]|uniref:BlaI/MecI/CopY family transcriptional regulator n=1 Tax=Peiella sedimenti TaxID=3061083 RepID=A0ABT8SN51_9CAUL|nr:BlaI/MecI/CopY family transcriptional regulator [Caulobacteraceae bacterium XZ-24]